MNLKLSKILKCVVVAIVVMFLTGCGDGWFAGRSETIPVIFDTDIGTDVDDAGALAILHVLADKGEAKILATISANQNVHSAPAIDVINTYYGRPDLPIGSSKTGPNDEYWYHESVGNYPHDLKSSQDAPDAVAVYRKILAEQPDNSVKIVVVGWLTNMADLLESPPDQYSPLTGKELVTAKVNELVTMGGIWPNSDQEGEYNFHMDGPAAYKVISEWPTDIMFVGLGLKVLTGSRVVAELDDSKNPIPAFYKNFFKANKVNERPSWDLVSVLYAVRGLDDYFTANSNGYSTAKPDGSNQWIPGKNKKNHSYLIYKMPPEELAEVIENLMLTPPRN